MSKQPRHVRDRLDASKSLILPNTKDPRQLWLLVRQDPTDGQPGCFFVTHGRNYDKFAKRVGFEITMHSFDKIAIAQACNRATRACGPDYQPRHSAHQRAAPLPEADPLEPPRHTSVEPDFLDPEEE